MSIREVAEGRQVQGEDEVITYTITTTNWASAPTTPSMVVKDAAGTDVSTTVAGGAITAVGDVITLKTISKLVRDESYRVEVKFTAGSGAPWECYFWIDCEE
jgi:hypothetical protein